MNFRDIVLLDFESTGKNSKTCQPVQLSSVVIHGRKLEIIPDSKFNSLIKPIFDEEKCKELNLEPLSQESIAIHGKTAAMLSNAPDVESVWKNFVSYVNKYNYDGTTWTAPIFSGYNSRGYDSEIVQRLCCDKSVYGFGPVDKFGKPALFNPIFHIDVMDIMFLFTENKKEITSLSVDNLVRKFMGYSKGVAHDAMSDVECCAELLIRNMKFIRSCVKDIDFKDSLKDE